MQRELQMLTDFTVALPLSQIKAMGLPSCPAFEMEPSLWVTSTWICLHHLIQRGKRRWKLPSPRGIQRPTKERQPSSWIKVNELPQVVHTTQMYVNSHMEKGTGLEQSLPPSRPRRPAWSQTLVEHIPDSRWCSEANQMHISRAGRMNLLAAWQRAPSYVSHDGHAASATQRGEVENTKWEDIRDSSPMSMCVLSPCPAPPPPTLL